MVVIGSVTSSRAEASFPCANARSPIEKLICGNQDLANLDGSLAATFSKIRREAGGAFGPLLDSQRAWLKSRQTTCNVPAGKGEKPEQLDNSTRCLILVYRYRLDALKRVDAAKIAQVWRTAEVQRNALSPGVRAKLSSFWGIDLDETFPEWHGELLYLASLYENDQGTIIARIGVTHSDKASFWDVDLLDKTKTKVIGYDAPPGMQKLESNLYVSLPTGLKVSLYYRYNRGTLKECSDPIKEGYRIFTPEGTTLKEFFILDLVTLTKPSEGMSIGGECGIVGGRIDDSDPKIFKTFVAAEAAPIFVLQDGSVLTGVLGRSRNHHAIWRFTSSFDRPAPEKNHLIMPVEEYNALFDKEGLFGTQAALTLRLKQSEGRIQHAQ